MTKIEKQTVLAMVARMTPAEVAQYLAAREAACPPHRPANRRACQVSQVSSSKPT